MNISEIVRTFLEQYVRDMENRELRGRLEALRDRVGTKIDAESVANLVREDRKSR